MSSLGSGGPNSWEASLIQAAGKGDEQRVREIVSEGTPHHDRFHHGLRVSLQKVAGRGHESLTRFLLEQAAGVDALLEGEVPPLFRAAESGKDKIVRVLLEYGASTETKDKSNRTAIFPAAQRNHRNTLRLLLEAGADVNATDSDGQNLMLLLASERSSKSIKWGTEIIEILLQTGIDLEAKDKDGRTALLWAVATGKETLARLLLTGRSTNNADINATNNRGKTALHLAVDVKMNRMPMIELLLDNGANLHARSDGGWTALHNAADKGHEDVVSLLLKCQADVNATTSIGMTALHWSARNGCTEVVKILLGHPDIRRDRKDSSGETPMLGAAQKGHIDIVKLLSPADDGANLTNAARAACHGFQATVVDFGMEHRLMNRTKRSVFELLYGWDENRQKPAVTTLVRNIPSKPTFRWIHLPTNNMTWVEALLTKHFVENHASDVEGFKALEKTLGQQHRGPTVHAHFMRPLCQRMQPTGKDSISSMSDGTPKSESNSQPAQPIIVLPDQNTLAGDENTLPSENVDKSASLGEKRSKKADKLQKSPSHGTQSKSTNQSQRATLTPSNKEWNRRPSRAKTRLGKKRERSGNIVLFMPYLHYETHHKRKLMSAAINRARQGLGRVCDPQSDHSCDEMLIQAYLQSAHNLHVRRTLDQFYYHAISTEGRDTDQVVYRYTRDKGKERKVFMVDQLWLWILSDDLIITSFPQRWQQPKNDPLNVLDGIIEDINSKTRPPIKSVHDLATLITGRCSGVFDRHRLGDEDFQFLDMFESSIGEVTNKETELFNKFNNASKAAAQWLRDQRQRGTSFFVRLPSKDMNSKRDPTFVDTLLDIGEETALLAEAKDIRDELNMISLVLQNQLSILEDLMQALLEEREGDQQKQAEIKKRFREQWKIVDVHKKDVERMDKQAEGIYTSLTHLLDLKQKHANAFEARFARDQAAFTGRQGQTIMVFTIVTIVFLPMSFIAAIFAIPLQNFHRVDGEISISFSYVSKFIFGVGLAISIPLIAVAFAVDNLGLLIKRTIKSLVSHNSGPKELELQPRVSRTSNDSNEYGEKPVQLGRRSGDTYRGRPSFATEDDGYLRTHLDRRRISFSQFSKDRQPDASQGGDGLRTTGDLERGIG